MKDLVETEIQKSRNNSHVDLVLRWRDSGTHWRQVQARTFRIAARIAECSQHGDWCVDPQAIPGMIGRGLIATFIRIELANGTATEMAQAVSMLEAVKDIDKDRR
jgi:hypothetical protein